MINYIASHFFGEIMEIFLDKLTENGQKFQVQFDFKINDTNYKIINCNGLIKPNKDNYILNFNIELIINDICDRCLTEFDEKIKTFIELLISLDHHTNIEENEIELTDEEMLIYPVHEEKINIKDIVTQEAIILRTPKRLCNDNCLGICPTCGINLNIEKCACKEDIDPKWQALKNI
jgi:uncharacterized protein